MSSRGSASSQKARQAKSKARLERYDQMREDLRARQEEATRPVKSTFLPGRSLGGKLAIEAKGVRKAFGDRLLFDDLNFKLPPNGIVGIIGPNGAGKTTLFR
jgi:sulfate-transporting ATPase